jgi:hypothetical protein
VELTCLHHTSLPLHPPEDDDKQGIFIETADHFVSSPGSTTRGSGRISYIHGLYIIIFA